METVIYPAFIFFTEFNETDKVYTTPCDIEAEVFAEYWNVTKPIETRSFLGRRYYVISL
jgi:hypothetical protein